MTRPYLVAGTAVSQAGVTAGVTPAATPATPANSRAVVADDDASVRRMLTLFLSRAGWETVAVESGDEALALLQSGLPCDLLVTDQSMPGLTGSELISAASRLRPRLPALLVTGYDLMGDLGRLPLPVPVLRKPVGRAEFMAEVERLTTPLAAARG